MVKSFEIFFGKINEIDSIVLKEYSCGNAHIVLFTSFCRITKFNLNNTAFVYIPPRNCSTLSLFTFLPETAVHLVCLHSSRNCSTLSLCTFLPETAVHLVCLHSSRNCSTLSLCTFLPETAVHLVCLHSSQKLRYT